MGLKKSGKHRGQTKTVVQLPSGLTRKEAIRTAVKKYGGDFRGFTYNRQTGKTTLI